jgi:hypothetical protein
VVSGTAGNRLGKPGPDLSYPHELTPAGTVGEQGDMVARNPWIWQLDGCVHLIEYG